MPFFSSSSPLCPSFLCSLSTLPPPPHTGSHVTFLGFYHSHPPSSPFKHTVLCLGNEPAAPHLCLVFHRVLDMTDERGPPELCSPGLQIKAAPAAGRSINQLILWAADQPINQSASQQMLLLSLSDAACGGVPCR